jgi:hypothetical protein
MGVVCVGALVGCAADVGVDSTGEPVGTSEDLLVTATVSGTRITAGTVGTGGSLVGATGGALVGSIDPGRLGAITPGRRARIGQTLDRLALERVLAHDERTEQKLQALVRDLDTTVRAVFCERNPSATLCRRPATVDALALQNATTNGVGNLGLRVGEPALAGAVPVRQIALRLDDTSAPLRKTPEALETIEAALDNEIVARTNELPGDRAIAPDTDIAGSVVLAGKLWNAMAARRGPALRARGASASPRCENVVLAQRFQDARDGLVHVRSHVSRYFERVVDARVSPALALDSLDEIWRGVRCLPAAKLDVLDDALATSLFELYYRLLAQGKRQVAYALVDHALPVLTLVFDATKSFKVPSVGAILRLDKDPAIPASARPALLDASAVFPHAELHATFEQLRDLTRPSQLSLLAHLLVERGALSPVHGFGLWIADVFRQDRMTRVGVQRGAIAIEPFDLLRAMLDPFRLGEGDCSLMEMTRSGLQCRTQKTCKALENLPSPGGSSASSVGGLSGSLAGVVPRGTGSIGVDRGFAVDALRGPTGAFGGGGYSGPGAMRSPLTHFGLERSSLGGHCGRGGSRTAASPAAACSAAIKSTSGKFSIDPEVDRVMRCALEVSTESGARVVAAETTSAANRGCFVRNAAGQCDNGDCDEAPGRPTEQQNQAERDYAARMAIAARSSEMTRVLGELFDRARAAGLVAPNVTREQALAVAVTAIGANLAGGLRADDELTGDNIAATRPNADGTAGGIRFSAEVANDPRRSESAEFAGMHESGHVALRAWEATGIITSSGSAARHHALMDQVVVRDWNGERRTLSGHRLGNLCADSDRGCSSCSAGDYRTERMTQCLSDKPRPIRDPNEPCGPTMYCTWDQWVAATERHYAPAFAGSCAPAMPAPVSPACFAVTCDPSALSSGTFSACCGQTGGGGGVRAPGSGCGPYERPSPDNPTCNPAIPAGSGGIPPVPVPGGW